MDYQIFAVQRYKINMNALSFYEYHNMSSFFKILAAQASVAVESWVPLSAVSFSAEASKGCHFHRG